MSVIVVSTTEPDYDYGVPSSSIDISEIDTSVEYESDYVPSYEWDISYYSSTGAISDAVGISSVTFKSDSPSNGVPGDPGSTDTYEILYTDSTTDTFVVYNGADGATGSIGPAGSDGRGITSIARTSGDGSAGTIDTYTISYTDGTTDTFDVTNGADGVDGRGITSIIFKTDTDGNDIPGDSGSTDTYEISYTDGTTSTFDVYNGIDGAAGTDGNTISTGAGAPSGGNDGDLYIDTSTNDLYENQSDVWTIVGNIEGDKGDTGAVGADGISLNWLADSATVPTTPSENDAYYNTTDNKSYVYDGAAWQTVVEDGAAGLDGADGSDGIDGDQWVYGAGAPTDISSQTYDTYYIDTDTNEVYYKASGTTSWSKITTLTGALYTTTSTDTIDLSAKSVGDTFTLNITDSGMSYTVGQILVVANSNTARFYAEVASYTGGTSISLTITHITGSTSHSSWDVNLSGVPYTYDDTVAGQAFEVELDAATTVSGRIALTPVVPDGWSLTDGSAGGVTQNDPDDLIINHNVTDSSGNYRPVFEARIMYKAGSAPDTYVSFVGDAAYTKLANDTTNGKVELASLTSENYLIKIHLIFA